MSQQLYEFTRLGYEIHGIVHVGMNEGQEIPVYLQNGWGPILGFEPISSVFESLYEKFWQEINNGDLLLLNCALANFSGRADILIPFDTQGQDDTPRASLLKEGWRSLEKPDGSPLAGYKKNGVWVYRFDDVIFPKGAAPSYDAFVVDVQGMEMHVLQGAEWRLRNFKYLVIECSEVPIYEGEAPASEVISWLYERGFDAITPTLPHDDIMFLRRD